MSITEVAQRTCETKNTICPKTARTLLENTGLLLQLDSISREMPEIKIEEVVWDSERHPNIEGVIGKNGNSAGLALKWDEHLSPAYNNSGDFIGIYSSFKTVTIEVSPQKEICIRGGNSYDCKNYDLNNMLIQKNVLVSAINKPREIRLLRPSPIYTL